MKDKSSILQNQLFTEIFFSLIAIISALLVGALAIMLLGYDVGQAGTALYQGAFGNTYNIAQTLLRSIPLIFTGLAVAIGFQAGLFNIGAEGQLYWGAFFTAIFSLAFSELPPLLLISFALLAGFIAGAVWAAIPGLLKAKTGAHEVVTTIMFNYIAILATTFFLVAYFKEPGPVDQTANIPEAARLPELIQYTRLTWAIFIGILVIILVDFLFRKTAIGFDLIAVGKNPHAAEYAGINDDKLTVLAMAVSGGVAGLAGSTVVLGVLHRFITNFSPGYGFTGIAVAVLGRNNPWGVLLAALLFGALDQGGTSMQMTAKIPSDLMTFVQGLVILFVAAPALFKTFKKLKQKKGAE